jgi:hypothetical protein
MIVKTSIIEGIKKRKDIRHEIMETMNIHRSTMNRWIKENKAYGPLTRVQISKIISKGLNTKRNQIFDN